jgi:hypothetical protein
MQHQAIALLRGDAAAKGMRLVQGAGDEGDTLAVKTVLVYDSNKFPFYEGELYQQFHDDVVGTKVSHAQWNGLVQSARMPPLRPSAIGPGHHPEGHTHRACVRACVVPALARGGAAYVSNTGCNK